MKVLERKLLEIQVIKMEVMVKVIETATISLKVLGTPSCLQIINLKVFIKHL